MPWLSNAAVEWTGVPAKTRAAVLRWWFARAKKSEVEYPKQLGISDFSGSGSGDSGLGLVGGVTFGS